MLLAEFSIWPMDKGVSVSPYVARAIAIVEQSGLPYKVGALGTCIEGEYDAVMAVIRECHLALAADSDRVMCTIKMDWRKGRSGRDVDTVVRWLTGYDEQGLTSAIDSGVDLQTFFEEAPAFNPRACLITGVICGVRVEEVDDPLMQKLRYLDKLVDEVARGKKMEAVLR